MARKRRQFTPSFKAKMALASIKGLKTIAESVQIHQLHSTQINLWKKQFLDGAEDVFLAGKAKIAAKTKTMSRNPENFTNN